MAATGLLSRFLQWLNALPERQGEFVVGVLLLALPTAGAFIWSLLRWGWHYRKAKRLAKTSELLRKRMELDADFQRGEAPLGEVDHGVISTASLNTIKDLVVESIPVIGQISEDIFTGETIHVLLADEDAANRQSIAKQLAQDIYPSVRALEAVAEKITPQSKAFIAAYRVLLQKRDITEESRQTLTETKAVFSGGLVDIFKKYSEYVATHQEKLISVEGKQQDLTRMVHRLRKALNDISEAARAVADFCAGEMAQSIDALLKP